MRVACGRIPEEVLFLLVRKRDEPDPGTISAALAAAPDQDACAVPAKTVPKQHKAGVDAAIRFDTDALSADVHQSAAVPGRTELLERYHTERTDALYNNDMTMGLPVFIHGSYGATPCGRGCCPI